MTIRSTKRSMRRIKKAGIAVAVAAACAGICNAGYNHEMSLRAEVADANQRASAYEQRYDDAQMALESQGYEVEALKEDNNKLRSNVEELRREVNRGYSGDIEVEVTAYTLSESDCDKGASHPDYGRTANGTCLAGQTLESARAIAVDPRIIPLGSKVRISFKDKEMQKYNGVYTACDTGGAIKGNIIDLFAGEGADALADRIGRRVAKVTIL